MLWFNKLLQRLDRGQLHTVNDSKTPSGRVHVGGAAAGLAVGAQGARLRHGKFGLACLGLAAMEGAKVAVPNGSDAGQVLPAAAKGERGAVGDVDGVHRARRDVRVRFAGAGLVPMQMARARDRSPVPRAAIVEAAGTGAKREGGRRPDLWADGLTRASGRAEPCR